MVLPFSPALDPVWRAVHVRLSSGQTVRRIRLGPLDLAARQALADLLGADRLPEERADVALQRLDEVVREAVGRDIREVVTELVGPIGDAAAARRHRTTQRAELWHWCRTHPVVVAEPALLDWVAAVRRVGLIGDSVSRTRAELDRVLRVLAALPAVGLPLPVFAEQVLGHPHALDEDTRCAALVLRALAAIHRLDPPADAASRRDLWERVGVAEDELSSTVLAAGLRLPGPALVPTLLRECAAAGVAAVLTLQQLRGAELTGAPARVWVVENPSVLSLALQRFGPDCPPLVGVSGWPSSAGIRLLRRLRAAGSELYYHGDFDGDGLRIAAHVVARTDARPWRMDSADYLAAVAPGPSVGRVTDVPWDPELGDHLRTHDVTVSEERVAASLLDEIG